MIFLHTGEYEVLLHLRCYGDTSFEVVGYGIQGHLSSFCTNCVQFSNSLRFPVKILRHPVSCYISDLQAPSNSYQHIASKVWGHMIFSQGGGLHNQLVFGRVGTNIMFKKYNLNNPKQSFTILSKVEGLTPDNLHSSA